MSIRGRRSLCTAVILGVGRIVTRSRGFVVGPHCSSSGSAFRQTTNARFHSRGIATKIGGFNSKHGAGASRLCSSTTTTTTTSRTLSPQSNTAEELQMAQDATSILKSAIAAVDPYEAVQRHLFANERDDGTLSLVTGNGPLSFRADDDFSEIVLLSFGKASSSMAVSVVDRIEEAWSDRPVIRGVVVVKDDHLRPDEAEKLSKHDIQVVEASHPIPDERSVRGAEQILQLASEATSDTLVICCVSGGGSALFCSPRDGVSLQDLQDTNEALLGSGMSIQDMNVIRKRLEKGKGGGLAMAASAATTTLTLVLSDILGDPLDLIASGPTVADDSTFADALALIRTNNLKLPEVVHQVIEKGARDGEITPGDDHFSSATSAFPTNAHTVLVGNNELAVTAAADKAASLGYNPVVLTTMLTGEAKHMAGMYTAMAHQLKQQQQSSTSSKYAVSPLPVALLAGGETTVTLNAADSGKGGRNQELALAAAIQLNELKLRNVVLASIGTDGTDGPTDAAGALVNGLTIEKLEGNAMEALFKHDAYNYFSEVDKDGHCSLLKTGPTGTNVADVCVTLIR